MLAATALRLAVIETLCPTEAIVSGARFPTLAQHRIFDSRQILVDELDAGLPYTPSVAVYTEDVRMTRRGEIATSVRGNASADLMIVVELSEMARDADGNAILVDGAPVTDAKVEGDARAQIVLDALAAQVRERLLRSPAGVGVRRVLKGVPTISISTFALPGYSLRWMRRILTVSCEIADDIFRDDGGLPEPLARVMADLPEGSYAKARLSELAAAFLATDRDALAGFDIHATTGDGAPAITPPAS